MADITEGKGFEPDIWIGGNDVLETSGRFY